MEGSTILVADDNELNRRVISSMLAGVNTRVVEACDGQDALDKLTNQHIDVALLDIQMPKLTGIEVMRAAAGESRVNAAPFIALTADTTDECRSRCLDAGAVAILHKPVSLYQLYRELHRAIANLHAAHEQLQDSSLPRALRPERIDYALLEELTNSAQRPDYLASLVTCFKREGGQLLEELGHAFRAGDLDNSRALLHRLKGMSGAIGADRITNLCHDKLAIPNTELCRSANALTDQLRHLHHETADALERYLSDSSPAIP